MRHHEASCIQGSTFLRSRPTLLASYINAEFFVTHFVFFPAMQVSPARLASLPIRLRHALRLRFPLPTSTSGRISPPCLPPL